MKMKMKMETRIIFFVNKYQQIQKSKNEFRNDVSQTMTLS